MDSLSRVEIIQAKLLTDKFDQKFSKVGLNFFRTTTTHSLFPVSKKTGIFCKWEDMIIEQSKLPIRFRLGSLDYTDHLEGKWEYYYNTLPNRP